jgi:hypothetical protein
MERIMSDSGERNVLIQRMLERSSEDAAFRKQLLADPKATIAGVIGHDIPAGINVHIVEQTAGDVFLVLPMMQDELSDDDLDAVAGGRGERQASGDGKEAQGDCTTMNGCNDMDNCWVDGWFS